MILEMNNQFFFRPQPALYCRTKPCNFLSLELASMCQEYESTGKNHTDTLQHTKANWKKKKVVQILRCKWTVAFSMAEISNNKNESSTGLSRFCTLYKPQFDTD